MDETQASNGSGVGLGLKLFVGFLVVATAALSVLVVLLSRENESLRMAIEKLEAKTLSSGLIPGDIVDSIRLEAADGSPFMLEFGEDQPTTLFFLTSVGCAACEETIPVWEGVLTEVRPEGIRIACVEAGSPPSELKSDAMPMWECYAAPPGREGWLRQIPVAPSALLIAGDGRILHRWYGYMSESQAAQFQAALIDLGGG